ncbi:MAG: AAA-like domain-containing protein [Elainella sp. Prado103]|nr:AAA-like domain-containing protein [Elainella sp. Prado103]
MVQFDYQVGGSLQSNHPTYVERAADTELYQFLLQGELCYAFNARQMGKSSLMMRAKHRLEMAGYRCAVLDMTCLGSEVTSIEQFYKGLAYELWMGFDLLDQLSLKAWWQTHQDLPVLQRLRLFLQELLHCFPTDRLLILIDEIDSVLSLPEPIDDFFALIRYCYDQRSHHPSFQRITFALFGVTTPSDLVQDKRKTPFNVGRAINLQGFQLHEVEPLTQILVGKVPAPQAIMQEILVWSNGQPFLTQKLCRLVLQAVASSANPVVIPRGTEAFWMENLVQSQLLQHWETQDEPEHLRTIRDRLLKSRYNTSRLLSLYQQIWHSEAALDITIAPFPVSRPSSDPLTPPHQPNLAPTLHPSPILADNSPEQLELLLSGIVIRQQGFLRIKNRIYRQVFDQNWVQTHLDMLRPYSESIAAWKIADQSDRSRLLRGQALQDAQQWAQGKSLSAIDYQFLSASQQQEQQEIQQALEAARLKEVEARLVVERRSSHRQRLWLGLISAKLILVSGLALMTFQLYRQTAISEVKAITEASETYYTSNQRLDALVTALQAAQKLKAIGQRGNASIREPVNRVLRQAVYNAREINRFSDPGSPVHAIAISPNRRLIVSGGEDRIVRFWQPDGKLLTQLYGHSAHIQTIAISPDSHLIATAGDDRTIILWQADGKRVARLIGHGGSITAIMFSPTGDRIASVSQDRTLKLWNLKGKLLTTLPAHPEAIRDVAFSADGRLLVTVSDDRTIKVWEHAKKQLLTTLNGHQAPIRAVALSPNNRTLLSGDAAGVLKLWTLEGTLIRTWSGHPDAIEDLKFSPLGQLMASAGSDATIKLWNRDGILLASLEGHHKPVQSVAFSPDGRSLISGSTDESIRIWQVQNQFVKPLVGHEAAVTAVAFNPVDQTLMTGSADQTLRLWNRRGAMLRVWRGHPDRISRIAISPDGQTIASAAAQTIRLWNPIGQLKGTLTGHQGKVQALAFSPNGQRLASTGNDTLINLWDRQGHLIKSWVGHVGSSTDIAFSLNTPLMASVSVDGAIKLWVNTSTALSQRSGNRWRNEGELVTSFGDYNTEILAIEFSPRLNPDRSTSSLQAINSALATPDFLPEQLVTAWGKNVNIWNLDGTLALTLRGHQGKVTDVAVSPSGDLIASASEDRTIKLWNRLGQVLTTLDSHTDTIRAVTFSPDSRMLASVSDDRTGLVWDLQRVLETSALEFVGCEWLQDYLQTTQELAAEERQFCQPSLSPKTLK